MAERIRFLIVNSHPIQYFAPLYREMATVPEFDVTVLYCSRHGLQGELDRQFGTSVQWDVPLLDGYLHRFISNQSPRPSIYSFWGLLNLSVIGHLWRAKQSVVIVYGWAYAVCWLTIVFAKLIGHTVCLRAESPINFERKKPTWQQRTRQWVLGWGLFRLVDYFLYIGQQNKAFYQQMNVPERKLIFGPYAVDNARFQAQAAALASSRDALRQRMGIDPTHDMVLYCGKYVPKKRPLDLLAAVEKLNRPNLSVVLMGDGELRPSLEAFVATKHLPHVLLTGFVNQLDIGLYLAIADLFVLCSDEGETWGLSANEAMNFGLPVVVSAAVGCADDLVKSGINGYTYPCGNTDQLADTLSVLLDMPRTQRLQMGAASRQHIDQYSYTAFIRSLRAVFATPS